MFFNKRWGVVSKLLPSFLEKWGLYLFILVTPLMIYPLSIGGHLIHLRKIREISFYSFAIIVCSFLQKSRWLRLFVFWCVINWWLNYFIPRESYIGLTNIFSALVLYVTLKHLLDKDFLKVDILLKLICFTALFQFSWMIMQTFNFDPVFYPALADGSLFHKAPMPYVGWSGNPCVLGVSLAISGFLLLHYFKVKGFPILFFVILSSVLFLNNATTAICFAAGGLFYLSNRYRVKVCGVILVVLLLGAFFVYYKAPNFDRLEIWQKLLRDGIKIRPFVGKGIHFFAHLFIVDKTGTPWREAHNDYLQIILELGSIGFILFSGWIVSRFVVFFRSVRTNKQICIASCLVAYLIAGVSLFPMHLAQLSFNAIVLLACLERSYVNTEDISTLNI